MSQEALIPEPKRKPAKPAPAPAGGALYQSVAANVRALFPRDDEDAQVTRAGLEGLVGLALALARRIDADPRASVGVAQNAAQLVVVLTAIRDATTAGDSFDRFLEELTGGNATAPHPAE